MKSSPFNVIAGYKEEKNELMKIASLIKNTTKLKSMGARLPKGLFLNGPNGVGKTVLAKAFIKEAGVKKVEINYNDINSDDEFTSYIKNKFKEASLNTPCILLVDEIDKLIGNSDRFFAPNNFDRSTVFLNELNRYNNTEGLFTLLIANQNYRLDFSIIRSGRIDKTIEINLPNEKERQEIVHFYISNGSYDESVKEDKIAKILNGFSGADIESLLNNALIRSLFDMRDQATFEDIMCVYYDKIFRNKSKELDLDDESLKLVAYHEAGHAVVTLMKNPESLTYVSLLSRNKVLGFVNQHLSESKLKTLKDKKDEISISLAGLIAEEIFLDVRTEGSQSDIKKARCIASELVRKDSYCGINVTDVMIKDPSNPIIETYNSQDRIKRMEEQEDKLLEDLISETREILINNKSLVEEIAEGLIEKKVLYKNDIDLLVETLKKNN